MAKGPDKIAHGALFLGVILSMVLYGIMMVQTLLYFTAFRKDPTWRKCLVGVLFVLETVNSVIDVTFTHRAVILHFGNNEHLPGYHWFVTCSVVLTAIIAFAVQLFFAWRIQVIISSKLLTTAIVVCSLATLAGGFATAISTTRLRDFVMFLSLAHYQDFKGALLAWFISDSLTNTILTITLVWHLARNKTGLDNTDSMINKVIRFTVPTGLITTVFAAVYITLFLVDKHRRPALLFYFPLSKLYTNSMLSSLNSRGRWRHFRTIGSQQDSSEADDAPRMKEGQYVHTEAGGHHSQDSFDSVGHKRAAVFVQVESHKVVDVFGRNIPVFHVM